MEDTIFALATAQGKAGVAMVRISGPQSLGVLSALGATAPTPRGTRLAYLKDPDGEILDHALIVFFEHGASFTGEDVVELHLHGSVAVVRAILRAIAGSGLARLAEPGEFTRRALMNGRLDLTQVQGLGDVIDAETEVQRKHAMRVLGGEVAERIGRWRADLIRAIALTEATIDFADEEVPEDVSEEVGDLVGRTLVAIEEEIAGVSSVARLKSGYEVALIGAPNAGKSSLLNALTRTDAAIVTEIAGTTRDIVEVRCDIRGLPVSFLDTAGLRDTIDPVEMIGVSRALARAETANIRILLHEEEEAPPWPFPARDQDLTVRSKSDLTGDPKGISTVTGAGLSDLLDEIGNRLQADLSDTGLISRERDHNSLIGARDILSLVIKDLPTGEPDIVAQHLRDAATALSDIVGGVDVEQILDEVFSSFCLGK